MVQLKQEVWAGKPTEGEAWGPRPRCKEAEQVCLVFGDH